MARLPPQVMATGAATAEPAGGTGGSTAEPSNNSGGAAGAPHNVASSDAGLDTPDAGALGGTGMTAGAKPDAAVPPLGGQGGTIPTAPDAGVSKQDTQAPPDAMAPAVPGNLLWDFESGTHGWADLGDNLASNNIPKQDPTLSMDHAYTGKSSLKYTFSTIGSDDYPMRYTGLFNSAGSVLSLANVSSVVFEVWMPADINLEFFQAFILGDKAPWTAADSHHTTVSLGGWTRFEIPVPDVYHTDSSSNCTAIGVQVQTSSAWQGSIYIDSISLVPL